MCHGITFGTQGVHVLHVSAKAYVVCQTMSAKVLLQITCHDRCQENYFLYVTGWSAMHHVHATYGNASEHYLVHIPACSAMHHAHATYSDALEHSADHNHRDVL